MVDSGDIDWKVEISCKQTRFDQQLQNNQRSLHGKKVQKAIDVQLFAGGVTHGMIEV